jgi:8-oxo-dGTP diphosphatase
MKSYIDKVAIIYIKNKKVLVSLSRGKDTWYIPGGKREERESDQKTLIREVKEELSVDVIQDTIKYFGTFEAQAHGKPEGVIVKTIYYTAEVKGEIKANSEIEKVDFFSYSQIDLTSAMGKLVFEDLKTKDLID